MDSAFFVINNIIGAVFFLIYAYQLYFIPVAVARRPEPFPDAEARRYAVLICARNEEQVIGHLIDSIWEQDYPKGMVDVFVAADNCTDGTAAAARAHGATVFERHDTGRVGKGYALNFLFDAVSGGGKRWDYEGYFIFDADNLLDRRFVAEMNKAVAAGNKVVTCYRNSKNYGDNWLSASYGLWFLRESKYLNNSRQILGLSSQCSGTGFVIHRDIMEKYGVWDFFTLTEDVEFTFAMTARGERIAYCKDAVLYDEQPVSFGVSWKQRTRWVKGYFQTYRLWGWALFKRFVRERAFPCYDMLANTFAGAILTLGLLLFYCAALVYHAAMGLPLGETLLFFGQFIVSCYGGSLLLGILTTRTEWAQIHCPDAKKRAYCLTFPLFLITLMPIALWAIFSRQRWPQIKHVRAMRVEDVVRG